MGAAEDDRIRIRAVRLVEVPPNDRPCYLAVTPALLRQRYQHFTGLLCHLGPGVPPSDSLPIGAKAHRGLGRQYEVPASRACVHGGHCTRLDHADDGQRREPIAQRIERDGRRGVAGHDQQLDALLPQFRRGLRRVTFDRHRALGPVGQARRIAKIDKVFARQGVADRLENGQTADTGIKYANRPLVLACIAHKRIVPKQDDLWNNPGRFIAQ